MVHLSNELIKNRNLDVSILLFYPIENVDFLKDKLNKNIPIQILKKKKGIDLLLPFRLYKFIRNNNIDIAHFHVQAITYAIITAIFFKNCKYIATIHNDAYKEAQGLHRIIRKILFRFKLVLPVTISKESQRTFCELYKLPSVLIYNGVPDYVRNTNVNISMYKKDSNTKILVQVASIAPVKNQVKVAKVVNKLSNEGWNLCIIFLGRITNESYGQELSKELSNSVFVYGEVPNPTDYLALSDFFVLLSEYEGMPISLLEAFSTKCIPIVSPVGGNVNVVKDDINGFVSTGTSLKDIYDVLTRALTADNKKIIEMENELQRDFRQYSIYECCKKYESLF